MPNWLFGRIKIYSKHMRIKNYKFLGEKMVTKGCCYYDEKHTCQFNKTGIEIQNYLLIL